MKYKIFILIFFGLFLINFVSANSQSFQMRFIVPVNDTTPPTWTNLRNLTGYTNTAFSRYITATDINGISCYYLNDTIAFGVDCSGQITNSIILDTATVYYLNISVNDTYGNINWGEFYINITESATGGTAVLCKYRKFGFYNLKYMGLREEICV